LSGAVVLFGWVGVAGAATIATPMLFPGGVGFLECVANNVGAVPISNVTVSIIDAGNVVVDTVTCNALAPSDYCASDGTTNTGGYCRVTFTGQQKNLRAAMTLINSTTGNPVASLAAD
jgi:hypothetical protein